MRECFVGATGVVCPLGIGARQLSASFRAGLSGYRQSPVVGRSAEPHTMALVPDAVLPPLDPAVETETLTDRERRMLRLGGMALREAAGGLSRTAPLFLALPRRDEPAPPRERELLQLLGIQAGARLDLARSRTFELGRAGGLFALEAGLAAIAAGHQTVLVGGVDTYLDLTLLVVLDAERRLLGPDVKDGFVPGEGAAFLTLTRARPRSVSAPTIIRATGTAQDPGHRYSEQPALGAGLSAALDDALSKHGPLPAVRTCFAGLNGESFGSKEWGVASMRHHELFDSALAFEHPADGFGDAGAATGTLLIALADEMLQHEHRAGPMLVWASSDHEPCGCAYVAAAGTEHESSAKSAGSFGAAPGHTEPHERIS